MATNFKRGAALLTALFALVLGTQPLYASQSQSTSDLPETSSSAASDVGFFVRARIPENQIDTRQTYFDLLMQPRQTQTLEVEVVNESAETLTLDISAISASTNQNGIIDYRTPDIRDETLATPFSEIARVEQPEMEIAPYSSAVARVRVEMPDKEYDGVVLGGIVLTRRPEGASDEGSSSAADGASIQNVYNYVIGVKLTETDAEVLPDFELLDVAAESVNYRPSYVHYIRNREAAIVKGMEVDIVITREGESEPVATYTRENIDMAPNSVMELGVASEGEITRGEYNALVTLRLGDETWRFERSFTVGSGEVQEANRQPERVTGTLPWWVFALIALVVLLLALWLFLLFKRRRRGEEEDET